MKLLVVALLAILTGCATNQGTLSADSQRLQLTSKPVTGLECTLTNDKGTQSVTTPSVVAIHRSHKPLVIDCVQTITTHKFLFFGVKTETHKYHMVVNSKIRPYVYGEALLPGGLIFSAISVFDRHGFAYPTLVNVNTNQESRK